MTTAPQVPAFDVDGPLPVAVSVSRLLRSLPAPTDPAALIPWLARKADLFDQIATATADPGLADDARAVAAAARHTLADLTAPAVPASSLDVPAPAPVPALPGGAA
jgi:hypothetical protein